MRALLSYKEKREVYKLQKGRCFLCGEPMSFDESTVDHFYPKSLGKKVGNNETSLRGNHTLAHAKCNREKADRKPTTDEVTKYWQVFGRMPRLFKTQGVHQA